jgi:hypothetical protein
VGQIQTVFVFGLSTGCVILVADLIVWVWTRRCRRSSAEAVTPPPVDHAAFREGFVVLTCGCLAITLAAGLPVAWKSPSDVPLEMFLVSGYGVVAGVPIAGWGLLTVGRAARRSGGVLGPWGRSSLGLPWILGIGLILGSVCRRMI